MKENNNFEREQKNIVDNILKKRTEVTKKKEPISTKRKKIAFLKALAESMGLISPAMKAVGIESRQTIYNWKKTDQDFCEKMEECTETFIDVVESKLMQQIVDGNLTAIIFYLKTKGKSRGYVERAEITGKDGSNVFGEEPEFTMEEAREYFQELNKLL